MSALDHLFAAPARRHVIPPIPHDRPSTKYATAKITAALMARGYTAADMKKLLGGNLLRVFRDVQAAADTSK